MITVRILDSEKFGYVQDCLRFYGIKFEIVPEEEINGDNIPTSGKQNLSKAPGKRSIDPERVE
jgi:hypothetical protein